MISHKTELRCLPVLANQETLKHILIGDLGAIFEAQDLLATLRYAEQIFWSKPQPIGTTGEYISVLMRKSAPGQAIVR